MDLRQHPWVVVVLVAALFGVGALVVSATSHPKQRDPVVERISLESDCSVLQGEFDRADAARGRGDERGTAWMRAADARMHEVGCYS